MILLATRYGHEKCIEILVRAGAGVNCKNKCGESPIQLAVESKQEGCLTCLIKSAADVNTNTREDLTILMSAVARGYHECVEMLVEAGAELNLKDDNGETALFWAVRDKKHKCVEILLRAGANVNVRDKRGETALYVAVCIDVKLMLPLLEAGADVNIMDICGGTALMEVAYKGPDDCFMHLLEAGADVNKISRHGTTALISASRVARHKLIQSLIGKGADVNIANHDGFTALHELMVNAHKLLDVTTDLINSIKALLAAGANVNKVITCGCNATSLYSQQIHHKRAIDPVIMLMFSAGERLADSEFIADNTDKDENQLNLRDLCRNTIREHLLDLDPYENLFVRVPRLEIPVIPHDYLLHDQTLDQDK